MPSSLYKKRLAALFKKYPSVKLAYVFGSRARKDAGPLSDYDIAVYADERDRETLVDLRLSLIADVCQLLETDAVDIVLLNNARQPELKYAIIKEGELIYERSPFKLLVEPMIMHEYHDFRAILVRHGISGPDNA